MQTMTAMLRTPIGDLRLVASERGLCVIEFIEVHADKDRQLANVRMAPVMNAQFVHEQLANGQFANGQLANEQYANGQSANAASTEYKNTQKSTAHELRQHQAAMQQPIDQAIHCQILQKPTLLPSDMAASLDLEIKSTITVNLQHALAQLSEYFAQTRRTFSLQLAPQGTEFQQQVWRQLQQINYGQPCSYADVAKAIARPKAVRAVGAANGRNPLAIVVPCHRVIGQNGSMTGYAGGLSRKIWLLNHEQTTNLT
jgi:methylated-DNA-[protein]-cysteine S-methyltransferase